ncbi:MAG TPA: cytochrome c-type biogenesis CcmF C-terminal domain-containing protein [Brevefilum fermentans]|jgi:cytochrome c-type biogenesis protein CcmF|nr:cytochrome c-type biogenesis CcmF C-terminal domain-containing protein [Brevefilum fermentans]
MMLSVLGYLALALAFLFAVFGLMAALFGVILKEPTWIKYARSALLLIFPLVTISLVVLLLMLAGLHFELGYVYSVTSRDMPLYMRLTALWGGQSGSLLFWSWLLAGFSLVFGLRKWRQENDIFAWALVVVFFTLGFFLMINVLFESPFERLWHMTDGSRILSLLPPSGAWLLIPADGQGLNPLLRHPGMIWHPPVLYLGFIGFIIPFALAIGSLAAGRHDRRWLEIARPWILITWIFLSLGLVLGMRWAYDVLGWGGYWGWDPVEVAALLPWLSATALLHTQILQERRDSFKRWNYALVVLTFVLVIFGTFITRSGVLSSVHTFAGGSIWLPMLIYTTVLVLVSLGLLAYRWRDLRAEYEPEFGFNKETLVLFTNLVLLSILVICLLGVIYPLLSELLTNTQITVGPAWYKRITGPLFIVLVLLVGVCPLAVWSGTNLLRLKKRVWFVLLLSVLVPLLTWLLGEVRNGVVLLSLWLVGFSILVMLADYLQQVIAAQRNHGGHIISALWMPVRRNLRRYGGVLVHLGIILMTIGIIGIEGLQQEIQTSLIIGEQVELSGFVFKFESLEHSEDEGRLITEAVLSISRDGKPRGVLYPRREIFTNMGLAITHPGLKSNLAADLYAILIDWQPGSQDQTAFSIYYNPLVSWLWIGAAVLTLGAILAVLPEKPRKTH